MLFLIFALALASICAPVLIRILGRPAFGLLALVPAGGFIWVLSTLKTSNFHVRTFHQDWMPAAKLNISLRMDELSALFLLIILGIGTLILLYCWGYFQANPKRLAVFGGQMVAFAFAMTCLVIADNLLLMYVFWEITSVLSFLLVGYYGERASSRRSALQALMVTGSGGLAMLVGIILIGTSTGIWALSDFAVSGISLAKMPGATIAVILMLAGALSKSAIAPAHFWLPGAMAAPTPVSAYLHSAAMVKAGIYLTARLSPYLSEVSTWLLIIIPAGLFTMLLGGWMALQQRDLKLILAYGTISQLGFITAIMGIGSPQAIQAGLALTVGHALFKAALFMVVGAIDHTTGTRDVDKLSGLGKKQPGLATIATLSALSMAGVPPLLGFVAKETALGMLLTEPALVGMPGKLSVTAVVLGSMLTFAYAMYFLYGAFATKQGQDVSTSVLKMHRITVGLWLPPLVLTILTVVLGLQPRPVDYLVANIVVDIFGQGVASSLPHLALWHGISTALLLSLLIIVCGSILHWQRDVVAKLHFTAPALGSADVAYDAVLNTFRRVSLRITATTQRGSLPLNEGVILLTLVLVPIAALLSGARNTIRMELWDSPTQGFIAVLMMIAALAATVMTNRLSALIFVSITGYGLAMIFALHGAPDLALTQLLVETISVVVFALVLRKFPASTQTKEAHVRLRAWLSIAVGVTVVILGAFAMNARDSVPLSQDIPTLAKEIGHGLNSVNVLLVDIRAWDTFGEISVLVVVATGVASLVYRTRSFARITRRPVSQAGGSPWLATASENVFKAKNRSLMVEVATRILFPSMMLLSAYFFFAGHNAPGGGFAGGLVAALAFTLRYLAGGREELDAAIPVDASKLLGWGLLSSGSTVIIPMFLGLSPLTSGILDLHLPLIGELHVVSALVFDAGVYFIVIGLVLHILRSLGAQLDHEERMAKERRKAAKTASAAVVAQIERNSR